MQIIFFAAQKSLTETGSKLEKFFANEKCKEFFITIIVEHKNESKLDYKFLVQIL